MNFVKILTSESHKNYCGLTLIFFFNFHLKGILYHILSFMTDRKMVY